MQGEKIGRTLGVGEERRAELCPIKRLSHCTGVAQRDSEASGCSSAGKCTHYSAPSHPLEAKGNIQKDWERCERDA